MGKSGPKAMELFRSKRHYADGATLEMTLWVVPAPVRGSRHRIKYSLYYGVPGQRLVGYDNEPGKGDHRHYGTVEQSYAFKSVEQLVSDFLEDVRRVRGGRL